MSSWKRRLGQRATDLFGLPPDALLTVSRVTCIGASQVVVENAVNLSRVTENHIEVELEEQWLTVQGHSFVVTLVSSKEVHIEGVVSGITYQPKGGVVR